MSREQFAARLHDKVNLTVFTVIYSARANSGRHIYCKNLLILISRSSTSQKYHAISQFKPFHESPKNSHNLFRLLTASIIHQTFRTRILGLSCL